MSTCCSPQKQSKKTFISSIWYGLIPHSFCIAFILFSVLGVTAGTAIIKQFLMIPYFFESLIVLSLILTTISAAIYLKKINLLSLDGIKNKWKYLTIMYSIVLFVNIFMFSFVFPALANANNSQAIESSANYPLTTLAVNIPCSGHATLIISELKKDLGVKSVIFKTPNIFEIRYNPLATSVEKITALDIFKQFTATIR